MPHLQNEKARLQASIQAASVDVTNLTSQQQAHQQAISAAQSRTVAAQARVTAAQARIPSLEADLAAADQQLIAIRQQASTHARNEPDEIVIVQNKPRLNPAWTRWKTRQDELNSQVGSAQSTVTRVHASLNGARVEVSQATAEVAAAQREVAQATAAVQATQQAIAAAGERQRTTQIQVATLDRWNDEIARDPLVRAALEPVAAELSERVHTLEDAHALARVQREIAQDTLVTLSARRDQLVPVLSQVNAQLPAASEQLRAAQQALATATTNIQVHRQRGPQA